VLTHRPFGRPTPVKCSKTKMRTAELKQLGLCRLSGWPITTHPPTRSPGCTKRKRCQEEAADRKSALADSPRAMRASLDTTPGLHNHEP